MLIFSRSALVHITLLVSVHCITSQLKQLFYTLKWFLHSMSRQSVCSCMPTLTAHSAVALLGPTFVWWCKNEKQNIFHSVSYLILISCLQNCCIQAIPHTHTHSCCCTEHQHGYNYLQPNPSYVDFQYNSMTACVTLLNYCT